MLDLSKHRAAIQSDCDSCRTSSMPKFTRPPFPQKHIPSEGTPKLFAKRELQLWRKLSVELFDNSPFIIRVYLGLATVLLFVTIVRDEVTPKDMCIHTKLIIVRDLN